MSEYAIAKEHYQKARKLGLKELSVRRARGENGYLDTADTRSENGGALAYVSLPTRTIPLRRVVGTWQAGRASAFAHNFMPVLSENSEFADKWTHVCAIQLNGGLSDPIRVYEYLRYYYVVEGNKRVSVLKYLGALDYEAQIVRLIPQWDADDPAITRYYAFLDYEKKGRFPEIELRSAEDYESLYRLESSLFEQAAAEGETPPDASVLYHRFETALSMVLPNFTAGDALPEYLRLYGLPTEPLEVVTENLKHMQPQLELAVHPAVPALLLDDGGTENASFITRLMNGRHEAKIVFAYTPGRTETNWQGAHERGRLAVQAHFGERVKTSALDLVSRDDAYLELSKGAADADLLFVTSPSLLDAALRCALEKPERLTLVYARSAFGRRLHTYFGRYYEAMFLCGILAGLHTQKGVVSYVSPRLEGRRCSSDVNAFTVGVKSVRPDARVLFVTRQVIPGDPISCAQALGVSAEWGADVVFTPLYETLTLPDLPHDVFSALVAVDGYGFPTRFLAAPDWNWDRFYTAIVQSFLNGSLETLLNMGTDSSPVKSFWWGIGTGVIDLRTGDGGSVASQNLVRFLRGCLAMGRLHPFHGPLTDSDGTLRVPAHSDPTPLDVINMEYLIKDVEQVQ